MANVEKLRKNLELNGFRTSFFTTAAEATDYLCGKLQGVSIGFGGSMTLDALGLYERLVSQGSKVSWHWRGTDPNVERAGAAEAEVYLSGVNAIAESGEIVNIDATGNRVAATLYGKKKVYFVLGTNKIESDLEKAIWRARNIASPLNARRFKLETPCAVSEEMRCYDCHHPKRICKGLVIHMQKLHGVGECEVIIIGEDLGY